MRMHPYDYSAKTVKYDDFEKTCKNFSDWCGEKILFIAVCAAESNGRTELGIKYNDNSLPGQIQLCYFDIFRSCYLNVFI